MGFISEAYEAVGDWAGDRLGALAGGLGDIAGEVTGANQVAEAQRQAATLATTEAERLRQIQNQQAQSLRDALSTAQGAQRAGYESAVNQLSPIAQRGQGYQQRLSDMLAGGPTQFTAPESQFRGQMLDLMNQGIDPRSPEVMAMINQGPSQLNQQILREVQNQGPSQLRGSILEQIQAGMPVSQDLQSAIATPLQLGPLEESRGYETMLQARGEGLRDLATQMGGTGKFFSGSTARAAGDISGRLAQELEREDYARALGERDRNISNLFALDRERYGRGQNQLSQLLGFEQQDYARGQNRLGQLMGLEQQQYGRDRNRLSDTLGLEQQAYGRRQNLASQLAGLEDRDYTRGMQQQQLNYGAQQDLLNRLTQQAGAGDAISQLLAQMSINQGNIEGQQTMANAGNIANLLTGGQVNVANLLNQAQQQNVGAAGTRAQTISDLIGAIASAAGSAAGGAGA